MQGAFDGTGAKTVIPRKVIGKFSIRIVPDQDPAVIEKLVSDYLQQKFSERKSPNKLTYDSSTFFPLIGQLPAAM